MEGGGDADAFLPAAVPRYNKNDALPKRGVVVQNRKRPLCDGRFLFFYCAIVYFSVSFRLARAAAAMRLSSLP